MRHIKKLKILMVTSELAPFAKAGGLGDMVAGLAKQLHAMGEDVRVMMPRYSDIDGMAHGLQDSGSACVHFGGGEEQWVGFQKSLLDGEVPVEFVEHARFFNRKGLYDDGRSEYPDNAYRFGLLAKAAMQRCKDTGWIPDVFHVHDWQGGMLPALLKSWDRVLSPLSKAVSVLTIHNIGYQGVYGADVMRFYGLGGEHFHADAFESHGRVNLLKGGIAYTDAMTTVSPTHAGELLTPEGGCGLAPYLNNRSSLLRGILNGADYSQWNPSNDPHIAASYDVGMMEGKGACRAALAARMGMDLPDDAPLLGVVSRLVAQKGFGLMRDVMGGIMDHTGLRLVVLGSGEPEFEGYFRWLAGRYPRRVGLEIGFSNALSHQIYAGSDFFLMPSFYEPCGLGQIYALRYGVVPVVRATGGLGDTVRDWQTGVTFGPAEPWALGDALGRMLHLWYERETYREIQQRGMRERFDWQVSAGQYLEVYEGALQRKRAVVKAVEGDRLRRNFMLSALQRKDEQGVASR